MDGDAAREEYHTIQGRGGILALRTPRMARPPLTRRQFLSASATGIGLAAVSAVRPLHAGPAPDERTLVLIELAGGNDGLNTVVPVGDDLYHRARGRLAVTAAEASPIADGIGLHPELRGLAQRYRRGEVAVLQGVGVPDGARCHLAAVDECHAVEPGDSAGAAPGWLGRVGDVGDGADLGAALHRVADRMAHGVAARVHHLRLPGFDTHAHQKHRHARLLARLDRALDEFLGRVDALGLRSRTLVVCVSEFGRRLTPNGTGGTDHGTAGPVFVIGDVRGGLYGPRPDLAGLDAEGDLRVATDIRRVHATVVERWLGRPSGPIVGRDFLPLDAREFPL